MDYKAMNLSDKLYGNKKSFKTNSCSCLFNTDYIPQLIESYLATIQVHFVHLSK